MREVLSSLEELTAEWLSGRLKARGFLPAGQVVAIERARVFSNNAMSAQLALRYSANADLSLAPARLFVKIARPDVRWNSVEYAFYTVVAATMRAERPASMWWERVEMGLMAFEDLGCGELLERMKAEG